MVPFSQDEQIQLFGIPQKPKNKKEIIVLTTLECSQFTVQIRYDIHY
jgi:hypothetical protein